MIEVKARFTCIKCGKKGEGYARLIGRIDTIPSDQVVRLSGAWYADCDGQAVCSHDCEYEWET